MKLRVRLNKPPFNWIIGSLILMLIGWILMPFVRQIANHYMHVVDVKIEEAKQVVISNERFQSYNENVVWLEDEYTFRITPKKSCIILAFRHNTKMEKVGVIFKKGKDPEVKWGMSKCSTGE